jgi:hypothetical protein
MASALPVTSTAIPPALGKSAVAADPMVALRMEMKATNLQLTYQLNYMAEETERRGWLMAVFGLGVILFTLYRWKGSLALRVALEVVEPPGASDGAGNA